MFDKDGNNDEVSPMSVLHAHAGRMALIGLLLHELGGEIVLTQEDFDRAAHGSIQEDSDGETLRLTVKMLGRADE